MATKKKKTAKKKASKKASEPSLAAAAARLTPAEPKRIPTQDLIHRGIYRMHKPHGVPTTRQDWAGRSVPLFIPDRCVVWRMSLLQYWSPGVTGASGYVHVWNDYSRYTDEKCPCYPVELVGTVPDQVRMCDDINDLHEYLDHVRNNGWDKGHEYVPYRDQEDVRTYEDDDDTYEDDEPEVDVDGEYEGEYIDDVEDPPPLPWTPGADRPVLTIDTISNQPVAQMTTAALHAARAELDRLAAQVNSTAVAASTRRRSGFYGSDSWANLDAYSSPAVYQIITGGTARTRGR